jgi:glycyl-tRNA synthetase (class II)
VKNTLLLKIVIIIIAFFLNAPVFSQEDMVVVDNCDFKNPRRPSASFKHDDHNDIAGLDECNRCHHIYENGKLSEDESSEDQKCSDCHKIEKNRRSPNLMKAYHKNCKGCHLKNRKGPVMCGECHIK